MMWDKLVLDNACDLITRGISPKYIENGGIRVLNQKCIRNHTINYELARRHDISKKGVKEERYIKKGDVLINSTGHGTLGRIAQVRHEPDEPTTVDSHITIVRPKPELFYSDYFGYAAIFIEDEIKDAGQGASGQTELSKTKLKEEFFVSFPSDFDEQQRIVAKLDAAFAEIDKTIHATKIKIQNYFKLEETNKSTFFSNLLSSLIELEKTGEIINGYAFKSGDFQHSNGIPVIKITNVGIRDFVETNDVNLPKDFSAKHKQFAVKQGDIVFALTRTVINGGLKVAVVPKSYEGALLNQRVASVSANPKLMNSEFLYSYLSSSMVLDYVLANVNTLMQPNLSITDLKKLPVPNIPVDKQVAYSQTLRETEIQFQNIRTIETKKLSELEKLKSAILVQELQSEAA